MVTLDVPDFVSVIACEPLLPTATFPKLKLEGLAVSCACTPIPAKEMLAGEPDALLAIITLPVALPGVVGANCAVKETLAPALIVCGTLRPVMLNPVPATVA